jgi:hypothetical protein
LQAVPVAIIAIVAIVANIVIAAIIANRIALLVRQILSSSCLYFLQ